MPDAEAVGVIPEMPVAPSIEAVDVAPEKSDAPNIEAVAVAPLAEKSDTTAMAAGQETKPADNTLETEVDDISNFFDDDLNFDIEKYKAWEANAYAPLGEAPTAIESVAPDALVAAASDASASDAAAVAASEAVATPLAAADADANIAAVADDAAVDVADKKTNQR